MAVQSQLGVAWLPMTVVGRSFGCRSVNLITPLEYGDDMSIASEASGSGVVGSGHHIVEYGRFGGGQAGRSREPILGSGFLSYSVAFYLIRS